LIQRVEDRKPTYTKEVWIQERRQNLTYLTNISRFPEGYAYILHQEGISPRVNTHPLKIRWNRSIQLQKAAKKTKVTKSSDDVKPDAPEANKVGTTRSVTLRIQYLEKKKQEVARKELELKGTPKLSEKANNMAVAAS
jgi:hypothetical protein